MGWRSAWCAVVLFVGMTTWVAAQDAALQGRVIKALFMTVWCPDSRSVESNCGIPRG